LAREQSTRQQWRAVPYDRRRFGCASGFALLERLLAAVIYLIFKYLLTFECAEMSPK
jgi:hypothetical protein